MPRKTNSRAKYSDLLHKKSVVSHRREESKKLKRREKKFWFDKLTQCNLRYQSFAWRGFMAGQWTLESLGQLLSSERRHNAIAFSLKAGRERTTEACISWKRGCLCFFSVVSVYGLCLMVLMERIGKEMHSREESASTYKLQFRGVEYSMRYHEQKCLEFNNPFQWHSTIAIFFNISKHSVTIPTFIRGESIWFGRKKTNDSPKVLEQNSWIAITIRKIGMLGRRGWSLMPVRNCLFAFAL